MGARTVPMVVRKTNRGYVDSIDERRTKLGPLPPSTFIELRYVCLSQ
jgi:hypothetical protein